MIDRIKKLLETKHMSPSQFADEINLQRSSLSHVLSGRNKPSLDFVMKVKQRFSEINLDWLIFGSGMMLLSQHEDIVDRVGKVYPENLTEIAQQTINFESKPIADPNRKTTYNEKKSTDKEVLNVVSLASKAERVIIFYNNGTFEEYTNSKG